MSFESGETEGSVRKCMFPKTIFKFKYCKMTEKCLSQYYCSMEYFFVCPSELRIHWPGPGSLI